MLQVGGASLRVTHAVGMAKSLYRNKTTAHAVTNLTPISPLINLTTDLDPVREVKGSRKLCSNPKRFESRIVQPITIQLISSFGWLNIRSAPTATINERCRNPVIIRGYLNVRRVAREDGGLHNARVTAQKEGRKGDGWDDRVRDSGGKEGYLGVW
jgi:hypothetical protein